MHPASRNRAPSLSAMLAIAACMIVAEPAAAEPATGLAAGACVALTAGMAAPLGLAQAEDVPPGKSAARPPMTERELEQLLRSLEPIDLDAQEGTRLRAFARSQPLPAGRMQQIIEDVAAHLALLHLNEQLERFEVLPDIPRPTIEWGEGILVALDECLDHRYAPYGGTARRKAMHRLVIDNRKLLEDRLFRPIVEYRDRERAERQ